MLSLEDCLALCELSEDEVLAIAHHEHIPEIAAAQLGNYLVHTPEGERRIKSIIRDDIAEARAVGDRTREITLKLVLRNFVQQHPCCDERHFPR
jgi:S-ribosylhomocysteine lyase LuxS involved in autoinducer biosynthesis